MEPTYSMFWKRHPSPAQQAAVQNVNEQGLFPSKNNRADFSGKYPAPIRLERTNAPGCDAMYVASACGTCPCDGCCPGKTPTPMSEIVQRNVCSHCPVQTPLGLQAPGAADYSRPGTMKSINRHQAIAVENQMKQQQQQQSQQQQLVARRYGGRPFCSRCGGY